MFPAVCDRCEQRYQVPDSEQRYRCSACGEGIVRACEEVPEPVVPAHFEAGGARTQTCDSCGASQPADANFCEACGESLQLPEGVLVTSGGGRGRVGRTVARFELQEIQRSLRGLRVLYVIVFSLTALGFLALLAYSAAAKPRDMVIDENLLRIVLIVVGIQMAIDLGGILFIYRRPMFWSVMFALVHSLGMILNLMSGQGVATLIQALFAVAGWKAVSKVARLRPLLQEYPELRKGRSRDSA